MPTFTVHAGPHRLRHAEPGSPGAGVIGAGRDRANRAHGARAPLAALASAMLALAALVGGAPAFGRPPTAETIAKLCTGAEGARDCARRIEAQQLKAFPSVARREGDRLRVVLGPGRDLELIDSPGGADASLFFALWDYVAPLDWVAVAVYRGEQLEYTLVDRRSGKRHVVPAEPLASVDHRHLLTVDVCSSGCSGEVALWRVRGAGLVKAAVFRVPEAWKDVTAAWSGLDTVSIEYAEAAQAGGRGQRTLSLTDPAWERVVD